MDATLQKVMVVDDEPMVRKLVTTVLMSSGYQVVAAGDTRQALGLLENEPQVNLLLTDIVMPDGDGRELARRMREKRPALRVLFMSGHGPDTGGSKLSGSPLLQKPFRIAELLGRVAQTLA